MRIKDCFVLQELADEFVVVPIGEAADKLHGVIRLNITGAFIWKLLSGKDLTEEEIADEISGVFSVDKATAQSDVTSFLDEIKGFDCLE